MRARLIRALGLKLGQGIRYASLSHICYHRRTTYEGFTAEAVMATQVKVIIEKHPDGYVAYPLGLKGVVVGEGDTYEEARADVKSAIAFHIETFGADVLEEESCVLEVFIAEAGIAL
jgi:predicted RNase H-like HicB family nuclease